VTDWQVPSGFLVVPSGQSDTGVTHSPDEILIMSGGHPGSGGKHLPSASRIVPGGQSEGGQLPAASGRLPSGHILSSWLSGRTQLPSDDCMVPGAQVGCVTHRPVLSRVPTSQNVIGSDRHSPS
jgi:hypothetical protein